MIVRIVKHQEEGRVRLALVLSWTNIIVVSNHPPKMSFHHLFSISIVQTEDKLGGHALLSICPGCTGTPRPLFYAGNLQTELELPRACLLGLDR